jgi:hypothetical protein
MDATTEAAWRISNEARRQIAFLKSRSQSQANLHAIKVYEWLAENSHALLIHVCTEGTSIIKHGEQG